MTGMDLGTGDGLIPATSEHRTIRLPYREQLAEKRLAEALSRPVKTCMSCGQIGAHWIAPRLTDDGGLVQGYFLCEVRR